MINRISLRRVRPIAAAALAFFVALGMQGANQPNLPQIYPALKHDAAGYWLIDFNQLASFTFGPPPPEPDPAVSAGMQAFFRTVPAPLDIPEKPGSVDGVPALIQSLDGQRVRLTGFMLPTRMQNGKVQDFLLIRSQMTCCYGVPPAPNEWVVVHLGGPGADQVMDVPIHLYGVMHVGAMFEDHIFSGLYRVDGEKVIVP